jgi:hypothetical protein
LPGYRRHALAAESARDGIGIGQGLHQQLLDLAG